MKSHNKNDMVKALTPRGVNLSDKSFLLVVFFLFFLIVIPCLSAENFIPEMQIILTKLQFPNTNPLCLTGSGGTVLTAPNNFFTKLSRYQHESFMWFYFGKDYYKKP